jgi:hypothetical protein
MHYHKCPECFEKYNCDLDCTLRDAANNLGANFTCALCEGEDHPPPTEEEVQQPLSFQEPAKEPTMTQEDWDRYNGFIR